MCRNVGCVLSEAPELAARTGGEARDGRWQVGADLMDEQTGIELIGPDGHDGRDLSKVGALVAGPVFDEPG